MAPWQNDDDYLSGPAAMSLPPPHDTPYRTPSRTSNMSRRSNSPPARDASPSMVPAERRDRNSKRLSKDTSTNENISILDPRRFTPTLHANLVSEILTLRRDQEEKTRIIESLEQTLDSSREEQQTAADNFTASAKENRSIKRQLALLEGGTSSALSELARERDEAVESAADTKRRLETAQKKIRSQEDDSERVHDSWSREKVEWEDERRKYERKIHVVESRLKIVLDEVAEFHAAQVNGTQQEAMNGHGNDSDTESAPGGANDAGSVRSMSMTNSIRFSFAQNGHGSSKLNGQSLADELHFDGDDDDDNHTDVDGRESALSHRTNHRHTRNFSRDSILGRVHRRNQSLESLRRPGSVAKGTLLRSQAVLEALEGEEEEEEMESVRPKAEYVDTGAQFSPPPSPKMEPARPVTPQEPSERSSPIVTQPSYPPPPPPISMVSTASQTVEIPLSPPGTPQSRPATPVVKELPLPLVTVSISTQTDDPPSPPKLQFVPPPPLTAPPPIPSINIMPPTSRPTTPRESRLPPLVKSFGCQVNLSLSSTTAEAASQTEGIKVDQRLAQLPAHLQPSSITSRPSSPNPPSTVELEKAFTPVPPRNPRRLAEKPVASNTSKMPSSPVSAITEHDEPQDAYPGNNDDGPLSNEGAAPIKRPHRFSSLFAGFDTASSDEGDEFGEEDFSDSEYRTVLSAPRPQSISSRPTSMSPVMTAPGSPEDTPKRASGRSSMKPIGTEIYNSFSLLDRDSKTGKPAGASSRPHDRGTGASLPGPGNRAGVMRKAAMIQSGIASHNGRARSPSLPEARNPPFPIPKRESSRKPSTSAPTSDGQRSPTRFDPWQRRGSGRNAYRSNSIRKVRSAAALPRNARYRRQGSRSPPPLSPSTEAPESPGLPPLPRNDITTPRHRGRGHGHSHSSYRKHRPQPSTNTDKTTNTDLASQASGGQTTGVVDAIAQTMVGEWMFKYVRRRKSFNVAESNGKDDTGNDRHKRWVWLAPYERAILWSSKQPSSGSALMGKTGRKLTIQSVLDVKDDNPVPKGTASVFNRSILILTPQRALKFTAMTPERHYVWLTALSFLAHSTQALPDIVAPTPPQPKAQPLPDFEPPRPKGRRPGIRDSIRLAKGRTGIGAAVPLSAPGVPSIPSAPSFQSSDLASFRIPETIGTISSSHTRDISQDTAEPPFIPRFNDRSAPAPAPAHGRKRSNTGGRVPPPLSFRGFSGPMSVSSHVPTDSTAGASVNTAGSSEYYQSQGSGNTGWGMSQIASQRTSEASSQRANFFDAIGTVRMEAFISPLALSQFNENPDEQDEIRQLARRRSKEWRRRRSRSRQRDSSSYASRGRRGSDDRYGSSRATGEDDYFRDDPFRGF